MATALLALAKVGLQGRAQLEPSALSFGQQQRVAFSRALVREPSLIRAGEPTANLDDRTAEAVSAWLKEAHEGGATVLVITHDPRLEGRLGGKKILLEGRYVELWGVAEILHYDEEDVMKCRRRQAAPGARWGSPSLAG